jgi:hypothetical protein
MSKKRTDAGKEVDLQEIAGELRLNRLIVSPGRDQTEDIPRVVNLVQDQFLAVSFVA